MYCSDQTLKDHANKSISRSETALTKTTSLQMERFDELKPIPQERPVDIQQDQGLQDDSLFFVTTIPKRSSVTSKCIISNVKFQQLSSLSEKSHERITDSCKINLPDPTVLTKNGNILLTRNQSQDLVDHEDRKISSNFLLSETPPDKSSLIWSEEKGVEQPPFGRSSKKSATKVHEEFMPCTRTPSDDTDMQTFSKDQHLSVEPNQNLSQNLLYKKISFSNADMKDGDVSELSDSFKKSSKTITISSHEEVPSSDPTTVIKALDTYLNQSQILLDGTQARQSPNERISLATGTDDPVLTGRIKPQVESEGEDTTKSSIKSFMQSFILKGKGEICDENPDNFFTSFDDKHTPHEESMETQQDREPPRNILPFESERLTESIVRGVDIQQKSLSFKKPSERITDPHQMTLHDPTVFTKDKDTLLLKDQPQGPVVQKEQKLPSDSIVFETSLEKSSIVRGIDIQKPFTVSQRASKNIVISTHEDVHVPNISAYVTGMLSAQDQTQLVVEAKQDQSLPHDSLIADVKGNKLQRIIAGSNDEVPLSGPSTTKFSAESIATKPVLDKTTLSTSSKKLPLPTTHDAIVQIEDTKCQITEGQTEAQGMESKFLSKTSILKPYSLERSGELYNVNQDWVVPKTGLQTQSFSNLKHILHECPLEGQHDQNLPSKAALFEFTPERTSLTSVELQQQSVVSDKPSVRLTHSPEITLHDSHDHVTNILLARDQPQSFEAQQHKKSLSDLSIFQTRHEKSVTLPTSVARNAELKLPLTLSSTLNEDISIKAHEDISLSNPTALSHVPVIPSAREQTPLLTKAEQDENKQHGCLISDLNVGQTPELTKHLGKSSKTIISSHEQFNLSDPSILTKDAFLSRNLNQEPTQTLGMSFSTTSTDRVYLLERGANVPVQRESTTSPVEVQVNEDDVDTFKSSSKQIRLERAGVVLESSEFTKKPSLQTRSFDYHKHTGHDYQLSSEQDQQLPSNIPVLELTDEISLGMWSKPVIVEVLQKEPSPSRKPSEKIDNSFEVTSPDSAVHTMATGIILSRDQQVLENLPSDSLHSEKTLEKSSVIRSVSDAEIQQPSISAQQPTESITDPHNVRLLSDSTRNQVHVPLEEKLQMLSKHAPSKSALSERSSSHKEGTLPDSVSQSQKESVKFTNQYQDAEIKYPHSSFSLYPGTSPDYPDKSDTYSRPLQSTNTVQCTVESPAMLLISPSDEAKETAFVESSVSQCECVTQKLNNLNVKTNEVAKFFCCINPETLSNAEWYHNDKKLATTEKIKFEQSGSILSLLIYEIQPEDQGIYSCVVKNKDNKIQTSSAQLNIEGGYFPCNHLIPNHHLRNIHIIPCIFVFLSHPDDLS